MGDNKRTIEIPLYKYSNEDLQKLSSLVSCSTSELKSVINTAKYFFKNETINIEELSQHCKINEMKLREISKILIAYLKRLDSKPNQIKLFHTPHKRIFNKGDHPEPNPRKPSCRKK